MTRTTLTPAPTIDTALDALRRDLSPFAADFKRITPDLAQANIDVVTISIAHELRPEAGADGDHYGEATVTRCAVRVPGIELDAFLPRSAAAAANWLHRRCADYADAIAGAQP